jgi:hypothetical protein
VKSSAGGISKTLSDSYQKALPIVGNLWEDVKSSAGGISKTLSESYQKALPIIGNLWEDVKSSAGGISKTLSDSYQKALPIVGNLWEDIKDKSKGISKEMGMSFESVKNKISEVFDNFKGFFEKLKGIVSSAITKIYDSINIFSSDNSELTDTQKRERANKAGYNSWDAYEKSGWQWKGKEPEVVPQKITVSTGTSTATLERIASKQLSSLKDIHSVAYAILEKMKSGGGSNSNVSISVPSKTEQNNISKVPPVKISDERGQYASSPYAFA